MGFWSMNCVAKHCGHPLLCPQATDAETPVDLDEDGESTMVVDNRWMSEGVALLPNGAVIVGTYDGYGRLDDLDALEHDGVNVWHLACWEVAGKPPYDPKRHAEPSRDQGWFFLPTAHAKADPRTCVEELRAEHRGVDVAPAEPTRTDVDAVRLHMWQDVVCVAEPGQPHHGPTVGEHLKVCAWPGCYKTWQVGTPEPRACDGAWLYEKL
jgi:hypothetical protein